MEGAFARLFRKSKLASFDRSIKQVYTTYPEVAAQGEWGLKRAMPCKVTTRLATIDQLDSKEQIIDFKAANQQFMLTEAWKENFVESRSPKYAGANDLLQDMTSVFEGPASMSPRSTSADKKDEVAQRDVGPKRNLNMMTRAEWKRFLEEARSRRAEWKDALDKGLFAPEETLTFMNATNKLDTMHDGVHRSPTYHDYAPTNEELMVEGRVLNRAAAGYSVAVQGIIAYLPMQGHSMDAGFQYRDVKTFYVHSARFDSQGRPEVTLGIRPRGARESSYSFDMGTRSNFSFPRSHSRGNSAHKQELVDRLRGIVNLNKALSNSKETTSTTEDESTNTNGNPTSEPGDSAEKSDPINDALDLLNKARR